MVGHLARSGTRPAEPEGSRLIAAPDQGSKAPRSRVPTVMSTAVTRIRGIHPGVILVVLDVIGLLIALYLSVVEVGGGVPYCGPLKGCETVAASEYSRILGIPVAVYGVGLSLILLTLAVAWIRTNRSELLDLHYGLSLIGVIFEIYFLLLQVFVIKAVCVWCTAYGISLIARFLVVMVIWVKQGRFKARFGS
jgi:uncharacterized membrane protein